MNYAFCLDENENYLHGYNTIKQTIQEAIDYYINDLEDYSDIKFVENSKFIYIYIGKERDYEDKIDADKIIEDLRDKAYEENEGAEYYLDDVNIELLQKELDKLWKKFKKIENISSPFFYVDDIKKYKVYLKESKDKKGKYEIEKYYID